MYISEEKLEELVREKVSLAKQELETKITTLEHTHKLEVEELNHDHKLALQSKEFELKHFKDEEVQKLKTELATEKQNNAVLKKENEMLVKITDLNADVVDVKELVNKLIEKLPEVKLNNLTVNTNGGNGNNKD